LTDHLKLITDLRYDMSDDKAIEEATAARTALTSLTVAAVYSF